MRRSPRIGFGMLTGRTPSRRVPPCTRCRPHSVTPISARRAATYMRDPAAPAGSSSIKECFFKMMMTEPALEDRHCATFRQGQGDSTSVRGLNMRDRENVPRRALCIWSEHRDRRLLGRHAAEQLRDPGMLVRAFLRLAHNGHRAGDEKRAQIAIALLGEPLLLDLATGRIVLWHDADPRRQVPAVFEQLSIGDTGPERTGDHRTNRGGRLQAWTQLARLVFLAQ